MSLHDKSRRLFGDLRVWIGIAYFALVAVFVWSYVNNARINREQALRIATVNASAEVAYQQCGASIPSLTRIDTFLEGVQVLSQTLLENAVATHEITPTHDPLYVTQTANLVRLRQSVKLIGNLRFPVPTPAECLARRNRALSGIP